MSSQDGAKPSQKQLAELISKLIKALNTIRSGKDERATDYLKEEAKRLKPPFIAY
jgi:hypothetical protein